MVRRLPRVIGGIPRAPRGTRRGPPRHTKNPPKTLQNPHGNHMLPRRQHVLPTQAPCTKGTPICMPKSMPTGHPRTPLRMMQGGSFEEPPEETPQKAGANPSSPQGAKQGLATNAAAGRKRGQRARVDHISKTINTHVPKHKLCQTNSLPRQGPRFVHRYQQRFKVIPKVGTEQLKKPHLLIRVSVWYSETASATPLKNPRRFFHILTVFLHFLPCGITACGQIRANGNAHNRLPAMRTSHD